ncbi:Gfo/Idh/MocA family oxidoreductase [Streptomyces sp. ISL-22]|uniref:Gfo/Idh/MocA family oxidoreductase n=1 Tax=unclassified Streptomyces TaxID=2593676 RepID=UPI001BEBC81E|nr:MULTISPECIES: Gfo/Idh/MocA family oxidoreductase [unclassified Streptomyces]MBT2419464.1 Gfo/Idh/MocA family oxidoreductase [Streptomyces sp. ISL-24]MBT2437278.1 Gfo/Idh/MocA family oxidoreductase [Streptomyces sp. ISL-22]
MSVVRIGVIGAGNMGADHVNTLHRHVSGAVVTMVADIDEERAAAVAGALPGARATGDPYAVIADPEIDAVVVASHDTTHADLSVAAVRAAKPVLCEKPLAPTLSECVRVVREERRAGKELISLGFMRRFDPAYVELKEALAAGVCGAPLLLHCVSRGVASAPGATDEFSITGSAIHEFDTVPWLLDSPVTDVSWHAPRATTAVTGLRDPQLMLLRTADGALTTVEVFLNAGYGYDIRCEVAGERGTLALTNPARLVTDSARARSLGYPADWRPRFADAYRLELQAWIDAVATGSPAPLATAHDGLVAGAVAEAVIASMKNGGRTVTVQVPEV